MKVRIPNLKNSLSFLLLIFFVATLQHCKSSKNVITNKSVAIVTYTKSIAPLMERSCTPCHYPEEGKKKMLNTFETVRDNIDDILTRVQLPTTEKKYMPFKSKKPAFTEEEITLLKKWVSQKMVE